MPKNNEEASQVFEQIENSRKADMKKFKKGVLLFLMAVILANMLNPMRRSEEHIRERMLLLTPVGTNMEEVVKLIERKEKWELRYISEESGYSMRNIRPSEKSGEYVVGKKSISVIADTYNSMLIIKTYVLIYWEFDENSKLVDVAVDKSYDVL